MPIDFVAFPGIVALANLRAARADHPVDLSGPALALQQLCPAIVGIPQGPGIIRYPLVAVYWLILPVVRAGADIMPGVVLADFVVHAQRCGVAFERCLAGGLSVSPCTPSVARRRIKRVVRL